MSLTEWEKMMDRKIKLAIKEKTMVDRLDLTPHPPFTKRIMNYECPPKFKPLTLDPYDRTKDLVKNV